MSCILPAALQRSWQATEQVSLLSVALRWLVPCPAVPVPPPDPWFAF